MMFFELRVYDMRPGKGPEFVKYMDEEIIPYQRSKGMTILASFLNDAEDTYVWIRRFKDEAEKEALYDAVYNNDFWRDEIAPKLPALMDVDGLRVTVLKATPRSYMQ
ncbi:MAG: NIPSNAP family protein [Chloroflexota bacterium]|nr:NIPSNAP family protein [Chloroflexota bacterium]MDE2910900.1 NIPSNAP family protein [Chloroflexota bacterium]